MLAADGFRILPILRKMLKKKSHGDLTTVALSFWGMGDMFKDCFWRVYDVLLQIFKTISKWSLTLLLTLTSIDGDISAEVGCYDKIFSYYL